VTAKRITWRGASFSVCRRYRWDLWRWWHPWGEPVGSRFAMFIGLNPSTADETEDDPTVRRCIRYAQAWGCDGMCMTNIFAWRDTDPQGMRAQAFPIGDLNDKTLRGIARGAQIVLCAWGVHGAHMNRGRNVERMLRQDGRKLHVLGLTKDGHPKHPLYLRADLTPVEWGET